MKLGLRIAVNTLVGAVQGVPALLELFDQYQIKASFFFATGPDISGRLTNRSQQPWYSHLPLSSRLYGLLIKPPSIVEEAGKRLLAVAAAGHETGILCHDRGRWLKGLAHADEAWTRKELLKAVDSYTDLFGSRPNCMASAGWQTNPYLLCLQQELGFDYASDVRGKSAFLPLLQNIESSCPQLPTTLPTISELLRQRGEINLQNVHEYLYAESQHILPHGHIYACDAEVEGITHLDVLEKLLVMWRNLDEGIQPLHAFLDEQNRAQLKKHLIGWSNEMTGEVYQATQSLQQN
ncbi:MAG: deacylase [Candidatus Thiodiazotropha taylori]|nr:deacylase [Candidatus Thiodiazotropha taylori]MCG8105789.1 deacylase [Candidatus Thiodiazotropha taylori]MCG8112043.1 deacylase [Candidatus Thiodiazotropha taylori]MCW4278126.1 deacylase [Candidatus Thiodiazotropha taylori]MCW4284399.1 deacylase [Candidatus Thiodiazotropha taylori]